VTVEANHTAAQVGDEPLLLARIAPTVVAHDRAAGAHHARESGASVIVMDDGFQNPSLEKDLSILVIDARRGLGNGCVVPAGPLRAPLEAQLARAHAILIVGEQSGAPPFASGGLPVFRARLEPDPGALAALAGQRVLAFAGIGDPEKFFATVAAAGIEAPIRRGFPDHHRYRADEAAALVAEARRERLILLTTEKDMARLSGDPAAQTLAERARALPVTLSVTEFEDFRKLVLGALRRA
jgi:tetraacyldisaccharide 4'-kinase